MSRITFLIGNGFDINAGLDTRYSDFYQYYFDQYPEDMLAKTIRADYDFWSDLEIGLGKYAKEITESNEELFLDSKDLIENALADYLEEQVSQIQIADGNADNIVKEMQNSILHFYEGFPNVQYEDIKNVIATIDESVVYSFISFNYTDTLDRCIQMAKERLPVTIGKHQCKTNYSSWKRVYTGYCDSAGRRIYENTTVFYYGKEYKISKPALGSCILNDSKKIEWSLESVMESEESITLERAASDREGNIRLAK